MTQIRLGGCVDQVCHNDKTIPALSPLALTQLKSVNSHSTNACFHRYILWSKSFRTDFFKRKTHEEDTWGRNMRKTHEEDTWGRHMRKTHEEDAYLFLFKISSTGIYTGFARSYTFWKAAENSSFWTFFKSSFTASWISATSGKWSPFNFIFNLGNRK